MDAIDKERAIATYAHTECSEECKKRGKNKYRLDDGFEVSTGFRSPRKPMF